MRQIAITILSIIIIHLLLTRCFYSIMDESHLMKTDSVMNNLNHDIQYIILGNSHAMAIQERLWKNAVNLATSGEEVQNTYFKLNYIVNGRKISPDTIVVSYDLGLLGSGNVDEQNYQFYWNRYEDTHDLTQFSEDRIKFVMNRAFDYIFPYRNGEIDAFDYSFATKESMAAEKLRSVSKLEDLTDPPDQQIKVSCPENKYLPVAEYYFKQIIQLCNEHNIKLVLVRFPVTAGFYLERSVCLNSETYYERLNNKLLKNNTFAQVIDFHNLYDDINFRDPHHLNNGKIRDEFTMRLFYEMH